MSPLPCTMLTALPCFAKVPPPYQGKTAAEGAHILRTVLMPTTKPSAGPSSKRSAPKIWGQMPTRMKVLYVTTLHRTGGWLAEAFAADCAAEIWLKEALGITAGLAHLRNEV